MRKEKGKERKRKIQEGKKWKPHPTGDMGPVFPENYRDPPGLMDSGNLTEEEDDHNDQQEDADKHKKMSDKLANALNDVWTEDEDNDTGTTNQFTNKNFEEKYKNQTTCALVETSSNPKEANRPTTYEYLTTEETQKQLKNMAEEEDDINKSESSIEKKPKENGKKEKVEATYVPVEGYM